MFVGLLRSPFSAPLSLHIFYWKLIVLTQPRILWISHPKLVIFNFSSKLIISNDSESSFHRKTKNYILTIILDQNAVFHPMTPIYFIFFSHLMPLGAKTGDPTPISISYIGVDGGYFIHFSYFTMKFVSFVCSLCITHCNKERIFFVCVCLDYQVYFFLSLIVILLLILFCIVCDS